MEKYRLQFLLRKKKIKKILGKNIKFPHLLIYRSNKHLYAQVIDKKTAKVLFSLSDQKIINQQLSKTQVAYSLGKKLAELAKNHKINKMILDRNGYKYHGRIKALAEGLRQNGISC